MVTFDGSTRSYAGRNTLTAVAERAYSQICAMYMGSRDCASAENRCPEPTTTTAIQLTESPTALPTAKPIALPTVPTTTGKPTTSTAQLGATTAEPTTKVQLPTTTMGSTATTDIASDFHSFVTTTDQPTKKQTRKTKKRKNKKKRGKRSKKRKSK